MITTVTLNASIDKAYHIGGQIQAGAVMRVNSCRNTAGGKGLNVARAAALCGEAVQAAGLAGGYSGAYFLKLMEQDGIPSRFVTVRAETRCCINILDGKNRSTEFLEPGEPVSEEEFGEFFAVYKSCVSESDVVTLSGSVPSGIRADVYGSLISYAKEQGKQVVLDTSGELLRNGIKAGPTMIKPNLEELEALLGRTLDSEMAVKEAALQLLEYGIRDVVVSMGKGGALLACQDGIYHGFVPDLRAVNTVGCGDSMVAAFAVSCVRGYGPEESLGYAVSVAAANAADERTGYFEPGLQKRIQEKTIVKRLS